MKEKKKNKKKKKKEKASKKKQQLLTPYLLYKDVGRALDWLAKAFDFREYGDRFSGADGTVQHAAMRVAKGRDVFMLGCPGPKYKNPKMLGNATYHLYINVDNVDKHFARAKKAGAKILEKLTDTFYGDRRYAVADLEGHQWFFAQHVRDVPEQEMKKAMKA